MKAGQNNAQNGQNSQRKAEKFQILTFNLNYADYVIIYCETIKQKCSFLVDTQADISVIKGSALKSNAKLNTNSIIKIKGITDNYIQTYGTIDICMMISNCQIWQKFHVVPNEFNIPSHGILGKDFIKGNKCCIDYSEMQIVFISDNREFMIPINQGPEQDTIVIPPRSEVIRRIKMENCREDQLIHSEQINDDVFVGRCIVNPQNPYIRIINTASKTQIIKKMKIIHENLSNYNTYVVNGVEKTEERTEKLMEILSKNVPKHEGKELLELCRAYTDIFALETDKMTTNNFYKQTLRVKDDEPVYIKNYRLPQTHRDEIEGQVNGLLKNELIEPSISSYNSPLILVPKKSGTGEKKWRMCVDFRALNKKLRPDRYPLPRIEEILDNLGRARYFSILDLYAGFHQIPLEKQSREITAFSTPKGTFQWKVLPIGLNIAPNSFMRMINLAFSGLGPHRTFIYMDDIIVIGCSKQHHLKNIKAVFDTCKKFNLKLNPGKCQFLKHEVTFLGHKCTSDGILPDETKLESVMKYPRPQDRDGVRRFTAFVNYYRKFIKDFANIAQPLNRLTRKSVEFEWNNECENAFQTLRKKLLKPPILKYPDFELEFTITVDASKNACGAMLSQVYNEMDMPISYISRSFQKGELNKATIEKELLAIHFAITYYRPYVYGKKFIVKSDHKPLIFLYNMKNPSSKLVRIRLDLEEYEFDIIHIRGKDNVAADALSRISITDLSRIYQNDVTMLAITRSMTNRKEKKKDNGNESAMANKAERQSVIEETNHQLVKKLPRVMTNGNREIVIMNKRKKIWKLDRTGLPEEELDLGKILTQLEAAALGNKMDKIQISTNDEIIKRAGIEGFKDKARGVITKIQLILTNPPRVIHDKNEQKEIVEKLHTHPVLGGHCGIKRLYNKIRTRYYWAKMKKTVSDCVKNCNDCMLNKVRTKTKEPMAITDTPQRAFDVVVIDTVGPIRGSNNGNVYILTMICDLTKYLITTPIQDKSAKTVARAMIENFILIYGIMKIIKTDRGTEYSNELMKEICDIMEIEHRMSTSHHHETVGSIERSHRTMNEYLRAYVTEKSTDWEVFIKYFTFCYNITNSGAFDNNYSPYELVYGRIANLPEKIKSGVSPVYNMENYAKEMRYRLEKAYEGAREILIKTKERNKKQYDKNKRECKVKIGDKIIMEKQPYDKHRNKYDGPFIIETMEGENVTVRDKANKEMKMHKNRLIKIN